MNPRLANCPDWQQFLDVGEHLLEQPNAQAQCRLIIDSLKSTLDCEVQVWLAEPYYPLPGEPELATLPNAEVPEPVRLAYTERKAAFIAAAGGKSRSPSDRQRARSVAQPMLSRDHLLGVIWISRSRGPALRLEELDYLEGLAASAALALETTRQRVLKDWHYEQISLVRQVSAQIANVHNLDLLCRQVTRLIRDTFQYYHVAVFTLEPGNDEIILRASATSGLSDETLVTYAVRLGEGMVGQAALSGEEQIACDIEQNPDYRFIPVLSQTRSEISLPLKVSDRLVGVLDVQGDRRDAFHDHDILVLRALADAIAVAVEGANLYTDLRRRADQLEAVFEFGRALNSILDLDRLLDEIIRVIHKRFGYEYIHLFALHPGRRKISYLAGSGARSEQMRLADITYDLDAPVGLIPYAGRTGQTRLANDVSIEPLYRPSDLPPSDTRAELVIPLRFGDEVLGVLDLQSDKVNAFKIEEVPLLESLAATIAIAYRNAALYSDEQWRRQVSDGFRDVAGLLSANVSLDQLFSSIMKELARSLPCDGSAIWLVDPLAEQNDNQQTILRLAAVQGVEPQDIFTAYQDSARVRSWLNDAIHHTEATTRQPGDPYGPLGLALNLPPDYSSIAAPLRAGEQTLGVITLAHHTPNRYGAESRTIITTFASYAAVAIQNARLFRDAQEQAWLSTTLLQVAEASQSVNSVDELLSSMVHLTRLLVGIKKCAMFLWDESRQGFTLNATYGFDQPPSQTIFFEDDNPALARLRTSRSTIFLQDAAVELNLPSASVPAATGTLVMMPLLARESLLGAFLVAHQAGEQTGVPAYFDQQTLSILQGIAHQTAVTLENLQLLEARQEEAYVTAVMLQVAQAVVSQNQLQDILDTIVHLLPILVGIDAAIICLWDPVHELFHAAQAYAGSHELQQNLRGCDYTPSQFRLLERIRRTDNAHYSKISKELPAPAGWFEAETMPIELIKADTLSRNEEWLLGFPLSVKGEMLGVLLAKEAGVAGMIQERRLEIVTGIAQQVALAIQNERLKDEMVARGRLERELQVARQIQQAFLPGQLPAWQGWEMAVRWQPARQVGGDFYDIFRLGRDRLGLAIADVSDKGLPAAMYMTVTRTLIRAYAQSSRSAAAVLERANNPLVAETPYSMFVTAIYALLWPESGQLLYANAGHNRPLLLRASDGSVEQLPKGGMALGVIERTPFEDHILTLLPGDCLLLYTDGATESFSPTNEAFGEERLINILLQCRNFTAENVLSTIEAQLADFREGAPPSDDISLLAIRRL